MLRLSQLTDEELLRHVLATRDPLSSTDLEMCLAARLTQHVDLSAESEPLIEALENHNVYEVADIDAAMAVRDEVKALLDDFDFVDLGQVRKELEALAAVRESLETA